MKIAFFFSNIMAIGPKIEKFFFFIFPRFMTPWSGKTQKKINCNLRVFWKWTHQWQSFYLFDRKNKYSFSKEQVFFIRNS